MPLLQVPAHIATLKLLGVVPDRLAMDEGGKEFPLAKATDGTLVVVDFIAENVPNGAKPEMHAVCMTWGNAVGFVRHFCAQNRYLLAPRSFFQSGTSFDVP